MFYKSEQGDRMHYNSYHSDILAALSMLHSQFRSDQPSFFVPLEEEGIEFDYANIIDPIIEGLITKVSDLKSKKEIETFFKNEKNKKKLSSILYATQFNGFAFCTMDSDGAFSIEQPCRVLGSLVNEDFYRGYMDSDNININIFVKNAVTYKELYRMVDKFSDYFGKSNEDDCFYECTFDVCSDRDLNDFSPELLHLYPAHFLSNARLIQKAATNVLQELDDIDKFHKSYHSIDEYFEKSQWAKPFINTIINDSHGLNYDEKTVLEAIAYGCQIRDPDCVFENYKFMQFDDGEDILDKRDQQLDEAYKNIYQINNLGTKLFNNDELFTRESEDNLKNDSNVGYAVDDLQEDYESPDENLLDEIDLIKFLICYEIDSLESKIKEMQSDRRPSQLYADYKKDSYLYYLIENIKKHKSVDLHNLIFTLNDVVTHLQSFDEDNSLTEMSEKFIHTVKNVLEESGKDFDEDIFKNSQRLYDDFKRFSQQIQTKNNEENIDKNKSDLQP